MKKQQPRLGRPPKNSHSHALPGWAVKRISQIARDAGASETRILELALQAGFIEIAELYAPIIEYARNLSKAHEKPIEPAPATSPIAAVPEPGLGIEATTVREPVDPVLAAAAGAAIRALEGHIVDAPGESVEEGTGGDYPPDDDADEQRGLSEEDGTDLEFDNPEPDRFTPAGRLINPA